MQRQRSDGDRVALAVSVVRVIKHTTMEWPLHCTALDCTALDSDKWKGHFDFSRLPLVHGNIGIQRAKIRVAISQIKNQ